MYNVIHCLAWIQDHLSLESVLPVCLLWSPPDPRRGSWGRPWRVHLGEIVHLLAMWAWCGRLNRPQAPKNTALGCLLGFLGEHFALFHATGDYSSGDPDSWQGSQVSFGGHLFSEANCFQQLFFETLRLSLSENPFPPIMWFVIDCHWLHVTDCHWSSQIVTNWV